MPSSLEEMKKINGKYAQSQANLSNKFGGLGGLAKFHRKTVKKNKMNLQKE